eukprot:CAMPEP_0174260708 /NCGR_PEP_ID=MMETSP0439-20130205/10340_1 /TAXON_ID=0 /ORGANISM="Stereomyxa ramosa, Strain Chinc5" /LENGTH=197 /DNA_ID=CAMNT_0015345013 /DNA_START=56 /DNA_END=649 /DNA_ORIENTATION=+
MAFELPELPWSKDSLAPHISEETIEYHFGKHHCGYVNKLNALVKDSPLANASLEHIILNETGKAFNCAAQTWNHSFYWNSMSPDGGGVPSAYLNNQIVKSFGSYEKFKDEFTACAGGHFGSGWAWLVQDKDGSLKVVGTHDAGNPMTQQLKPILTCDVWEHAYYIDYRNNRGSYIDAWWNVVNWKFAEHNLDAQAKL